MPPRFADTAPLRDPAPIALAVVLAMTFAFQLFTPLLAPGGATTTSPAQVRHKAPRPPPDSSFSATAVDPAPILDRPIFSPSRSAGAAPAQASDVYLLGTARGDHGALATLADRAGASTTLRPGETWQGWTLVSVGHGAATLRRGSAILALNVGQSLAAAPSATLDAAARSPPNAL